MGVLYGHFFKLKKSFPISENLHSKSQILNQLYEKQAGTEMCQACVKMGLAGNEGHLPPD
jgi:hypothetical protein